ncbi:MULTISPECIES: RolB family protein [Rhizobium]|uniref:RolB family protein n=1 Tax=Rhizobium tumorigenes TaxID=2041385 RepID=A0AAF1KHB7_9HYPH|nr:MULTISPECIES: RolB family protein [Rhizobium]MBO9102075.1 hypothetical protein [Rhizobium sp. L58/93]MBO9172224.1 hypothetical protein [Rhizobium sp. L245/93]MBO9187984.1 hypothetical protein [Rhizobium sp. E27B/91]QXZ87625.1 hypothetical protein J5287_28530 [Rhizobium sp. K1/93]QXZ93666.1 hypothetical protein J5280_28530 [Rhizobium sp. K15/93]
MAGLSDAVDLTGFYNPNEVETALDNAVALYRTLREPARSIRGGHRANVDGRNLYVYSRTEDIDLEGQVLYIYINASTMNMCVAGQQLHSNAASGAVRATTLPPFQVNVTAAAVCQALRGLGDGGVISYIDQVYCSHYVAILPSNRFVHTVNMQLQDLEGNELTYAVHERPHDSHIVRYDIIAYGVALFV